MRSGKRTDKPEATDPTSDAAHAEAPAGVTRREALSTGVGAVAAAALAGCQTTGQPPVTPVPAPGEDPVPGSAVSIRAEKIRDAKVPKNFSPNFTQPQVLRSGRDKAIRKDLVVRKTDLQILQPDPKIAGEWDYRSVTTRSYNGKVPGDTLEVYPGDKLEFTLINDLDIEEPKLPEPYASMSCEELMALDIPHCFNVTNLHTHGLHVSPSSRNGVASDDISIKIQPKDSQPYCIWLPDFHAPGTHWYHAHVHGSTALQVADGVAGALIVKEPDPAAEIPVDDDLVWLIQEIVGEPSDSVYAAIETAPDQPLPGTALFGTTKPTPHFTVNGQNLAELTMTTGEIHRWRLINGTGTPRGFMNVVLEKEDGSAYTGTNKGLNLMAVDGITFYGESAVPVPKQGHFMSPGNRADFLVQIPDPGTYYVWKKKAVIGPNGSTRRTTNQKLVRVVVTGETQTPRALPALPGTEHRPCYLTPIESVSEPERTIDFEVFKGGPPPNAGVFGGFTINGAAYGENPPAVEVDYNAVEEWKLTNQSGAAHPFHIHVNPFQVVGEKVNPDGPDDASNWRWQDTVSVPPAERDADGNTVPGEVKIRHRFLTYSGKFVIHCHVLIHEDCGMMRNVVVGPGGAEACEQVDVCICPDCPP